MKKATSLIEEDTGDVSGMVTNNEGEPLIGVTVLVKGTTKGVATDINGKYILHDIDKNGTLVFSYIGYHDQEVLIKGRSSVDVKMLTDEKLLDELVVVAFGKQKKDEVVGSVTTTKPKELKIASSNLTTALAGQMSGMIAYQRSGEPGEDNADFFIRGVTTFGYKKDPLILIDGIELSSRELARMQVDDIESFSILKDATATSLYGARGANGVILIESKRGVQGKAKVSVRIENSISTPTKEVEFADPITYMKLNNEAVLTRDPLGITPYSQQKIDNTIAGTNPLVYPVIDWKDLLFKKSAMNQRANLNVSGGGNVARYYLAATFNKDNGLLKVDKRNNFNNNIDLRTYELRANVDVDLTKTTEVGIKLYGTFDDYVGPVSGGSHFYREVVGSDPVAFPAYFPKDNQYQYVDHILFGNSPENLVNPYSDLVRGYKEYNQSLMLAQFTLKQDLSFITEGLDFNAMFNTTRSSYFDVTRAYQPFYYQVGFYDKYKDSYMLVPLNEDTGTEYLDYSEGPKEVQATTYVQMIANYNRVFADKHSVGTMLVFLMQNRLDGNAGSLQQSLPHRNVGISGRFSYAYDKKYYTEFDFGYNGSERFYKDYRFGFFPSVGLAWEVSNENFMAGIKDVLSTFKIRYTYGLIGNDAIGSASDRFFYLSEVSLNSSNRSAVFGIDNTYSRNGILTYRYGNSDITWEKSHKSNLGLEVGFFEKFNFLFDVWKERRSNILMTRSAIPTTMGLYPSSVPKANVGEAEGSGIDLSLDYSQFFQNQFWIQARANFTYASSNFSVYEEPTYDNEPWKSRIGYPINQQWGYIAERLFVDDAEVDNSPQQIFGEQPKGGDIKYRDVNGDGQITSLDQVPIGYPTTPEIVYGFGASFGYKAFDMSLFFQGSARQSFWIDVQKTSPFANSGTVRGYTLKNQLLKAYADDYWSEENQDIYALWPRLSTGVSDNNSQRSTWFMRNGSFLRLKNTEIGYTLPENLAKRISLEKARIYISGINLLTFSAFKLWDVEMAGNGLDYPVQKVYNIGLQLSF
ncbi:MAG: TonB-dependent receptor [Desulfitobacteriaceae bacterium]|nr:TonB-dependent receptor [Desulfitobacteriaceae bacterium]